MEGTPHYSRFAYYNEPVIDALDPPLGPSGQATFIKITGRNFLNTDYLQVRFGGVSRPESRPVEEAAEELKRTGSSTFVEPENVGYPIKRAIWVSPHEIHVETPVLTNFDGNDHTRLPLYVSNNGQSFSPFGVLDWDQETTQWDGPLSLKHFVFHSDIMLRGIQPSMGMHLQGNRVFSLSHNSENWCPSIVSHARLGQYTQSPQKM